MSKHFQDFQTVTEQTMKISFFFRKGINDSILSEIFDSAKEPVE